MKNIILIITNQCNLNCIGCLRDKNKKNLPLQAVKRLIPQLKEFGYDSIHLTGGEVSKHPKYKEIIKEIVNQGLSFRIVSNGLDYKKYIEIYNKYSENFKAITFSLNGADKKTHDRIRGKNSYDKVIEAIKKFNGARKNKTNKIKIKINFCLDKVNCGQIKDAVDLAKNLKVDEIGFVSMLPTPQNKDIVLSEKEKHRCWREIMRFRENNLKLVYFLSLYGEKAVKFCDGLDLKYLSVTPDNNLIFCCDIVNWDAVVGSLDKESLRELMQNAKKMSNDMTALRSYMINKGISFDGINTCIFCNKYFKNKKIKA